MFEVDETALEQFIVKHPGLRSRTAGHLRSICGLTPHEAAGVIDYLITEGWAPPPEASGSAPAAEEHDSPVRRRVTVLLHEDGETTARWDPPIPLGTEDTPFHKAVWALMAAIGEYDTAAADGPGEDGGDSVTGAQPRSGLRSQTPPTPLSSPDAAADDRCKRCGQPLSYNGHNEMDLDFTHHFEPKSAPDVAHDKPGVADPCWPHIPHQPAGAALEDAIRDALDWIPGEGRDQADCIADAVRHYQANASGSAPSELTQNVVNAARQVVSYRTGMEELRQALILFDRSRTSQDDAR